MATTKRSKSTRRDPAQKKAEMEALHEQLTQSVEALRTSTQWTAYLAFCRSFHRYSANNLLLILMQSPEASQVAGYRAWQAKGRQVVKGAKSIRIMGTGTVKATEEDEETGEVIEGKRRVYFPVSVFDIAQTDAIEGHPDVTDVRPRLDGDDEHGIYTAVQDYLTHQGVSVQRASLYGPNGTTTAATEAQPVTVTIEESLSPAHAAKTLLHEAAHITLDHVQDDISEYLAHRGRYEVEAESVAYVMAGLLGLDTSTYSTGYVAGWAERAEADVLKATASRVLAAVHTLAEALDPTENQEEAAA